jgi:hypothetical protein
MMQYIDARIRMPVNKLGQFVSELQPWAQLIGVDKLEDNGAPSYKRTKLGSGEYIPGEGTTGEQVLKLLTKKAMTLAAVKKEITEHNPKSIVSAFYALRNRGIIQKQKDGTYARKK